MSARNVSSCRFSHAYLVFNALMLGVVWSANLLHEHRVSGCSAGAFGPSP